ncbi:uncharacterized protein N7482_008859 [Penicillium canariense]|uniref:Carboxylic ester hydrolase n=1 Tax=Penicillium canariense TaxID=189055 RepID=A0A9W9HZ96_9EURO|nr:uncharacterized protein N7482_008859 [Penicillium canariense]KAJ5157759.1 hypothetical protein N7482_008859 [Penicillium canariense]
MPAFWKPIGSLVLLASASLAQQCTENPEMHVGASVKTSSGMVQGHVASQQPGVSEYLGIPYAAPPLLEISGLRPPRRILVSADCPANTGSTPKYPGFTPQAPQIIKSFTQQLGTSQSEDCLYLNVWTTPTVKDLKPVLFWIHGGRFTGGGANNPYYDGQNLAGEHEVVVVTINYRLNIFGFPGAPNLPQNVGLLDQRMAVEWVHHNIAAFGGDPDRITIFGQSAGGSSVDYYSYAWKEKPLVAGLISHSGTSMSFVPNTPEQSASYFYNVAKQLGCGDESSDADQVVGCVRKQPWNSVVKATAKVPFAETPALPQSVFHPTVDNKTVFSDYNKLSATGKFARLPYLVNSNDYEAGYYRVSAYGANISLSNQQWNMFNLGSFTCPSGAAARDRVAHGVPTWQSRYFGDWDNLRLYKGSGTYHGTDLAQLFGTAERISGLANSDRENEFARYIASAWVAFASDPEKGLTEFGWPRYNYRQRTLVGLAYNNSTSAEFLRPADFEVGCAALHGDSTPGKGAF